jgi:hypothetical protein
MCIPKAPQAIDVADPNINAKVVKALERPSTHIHTINAIRAIKAVHILYYETINSTAPSCMMDPIYTRLRLVVELME